MSQVTNPIILDSTGQDIALALAGLATAIANKPDPATQPPVMDGVGGVGSSLKYAREDHQHPSDDAKANQAQLAYVETGSTASRAYSVGEYFCWNGLLYRAKTAISSGGTFTPGTNCIQTTAMSAIRLATASWTTGSGGTVSTGLNVSTAKILAAFAVGYDISVYLNASGVQGYFVKTAGTNNPAGNVTVSVTAVILNY